MLYFQQARVEASLGDVGTFPKAAERSPGVWFVFQSSVFLPLHAQVQHPGTRVARLGCCRTGMIDDPAACFDFLCRTQLLTQGGSLRRKGQRHFLRARAKLTCRKGAVPPPCIRLDCLVCQNPGSGREQNSETHAPRKLWPPRLRIPYFQAHTDCTPI